MNGKSLQQRLGYYLLFILTCITSVQSSAQRFPFYNLNVESGLIQSQATALAQDKYGHLWIGTIGGLSRYDGKSFINYSVRDGMRNNSVNALATDKNGNIWIGGPMGVSRFDGKNFKHFTFPIQGNGVAGVAEIQISDKGTVWVRAAGSIYSIENDKAKLLKTPDGVPNVTAFITDHEALWIAKNSGLIYRYYKNRWDSLAFREPGLVTMPYVFRMFKDSRNVIWIGTNGGLYKIANGRLNIAVNNSAPMYNMPFIYSITEDQSGSVWFGTNSGAMRIKDSTIQHYNKSNGLSDNSILSVLTDAEGNVWLASDGQGIFRFSGAIFTVLDESMGLPSAQIMSIAAARNGRLYLGTYDAGLFFYEGGEIYKVPVPLTPEPTITAITIKNGYDVWFGTRGGGLWRYDGEYSHSYTAPLLPSNSVTSLYTDDKGNIWIGFVNGAMVRRKATLYSIPVGNTAVQDFIPIGEDSMLLATNNGIKLYSENQISSFKTGVAPDSFLAQCFTVKGDELWIGTSDNGVISYNLKTGKSIIINKNNGLRSDFIYNIIADNSGNIWAGTGFGIHRITMKSDTPYVAFYGKGQGVAGMESNHNAVYKMPDGSIWFGTTNGALHYHPQSKTVTSQPISIILQSVKVFGENIKDPAYFQSVDPWYNVPQGLALPYKQNNLTFTFLAISLSSSEHMQYRYKLEGLDERWSDWSNLNSVTFSALPPGKYTLIVEANSGDNAAVRQLKYPFEIITPFHQTTWFRLAVIGGCILLGITLQYLANRRKRNREQLLEKLRREEQNKVRQRTAEDFHDEVGNKLTRINVLTNVLKDKIGTGNTADTKRILDQIQDNTAQLYSGTRDILWSLKPSNDNLYEIAHRIRDFGVELFQDTDIDFMFTGTDDRWRYYKLPLDVSRNLIMIFKEALNNTLKYSKATQVRLEANLKENDVFQLILTDNGKGFDIANFKKGHGINNMKIRAKRIKGIIYIDSRIDKGTIINLNFYLPLKTK